MKSLFYLLAASILFFLNCTTMGAGGYSSYPSVYMNEEPLLAKSLFASDNAIISQAAIDTILSSRIKIPENSKVALIKFAGPTEHNSSTYGYGYWRSEAYLKLQQSYVDKLTSKIEHSSKINSVSVLPSLLTPQSPTIPVLREASVRLQSPLLVIYRINSDIYEEYRVFRSNKSKAYATVEVVLLDVRTGIIPFTSIATREYQSTKTKEDTNDRDLIRRTEQEAVNRALDKVAEELIHFLNTN